MAQEEGAMLGKKMSCPLILLLDVVCSAATRPATFKAVAPPSAGRESGRGRAKCSKPAIYLQFLWPPQLAHSMPVQLTGQLPLGKLSPS